MKARLFLLLAIFSTSFVTTVTVASTPAYAACSDSVLGIPAWYAGLQKPEPGCEIIDVGKGGVAINVFATKIALNIVRAALVIVGYISVFFIIKGGFLYIMARGEPGNITAAKQTITNAIIGLIIALLSAAIVGAVSGVIK
jgi:hypothetical protein